MAVLLTILKVLGILILAVLAVMILLLLLVLFMPFRYSCSGQIHDPEGSEKILHLQLPEDVSFNGDVRWLFGAVHASVLVGDGAGRGTAQVRVLGIRVPLEKILKRKKKQEQKKEEKPQEPAEKKSLEERIEGILQRVERLHRRLEDALYVLGTEYGLRARQALFFRLMTLLEKVLPAEWALRGVLGLGDPARSAKVYSIQGFLYPVTAGHVCIDTDYDLYRYDLQGAARGGVRLVSFVHAGISILLNRDVRRLISRLRRGPSAGADGNGKGHRGHRGGCKRAAARQKEATRMAETFDSSGQGGTDVIQEKKGPGNRQ